MSSTSSFTRQHYDSTYPPGIGNHYWSRARNRIIDRALRQAGVGPEEPILEIGCGRGVVVGFLRQRGWNVRGVEIAEVDPFPEAIDHMKAGLPAEMLPELERDTYRTILLLDVIEHIEDRPRFLQEILRHFRGVKRVLLTVPARPEIWSNYDTHYGHYLRYDIPELKRLAQASGMRVSVARYFFHMLYYPAWLLVRWGKPRETVMKTPTPMTRWAHRLLAALFVLEERILPGRLAGTSLLGLFERPPAR